MHLSTFCPSLDRARLFYGEVLGCEERWHTPASVHFDFFGNHLSLHLRQNYEAAPRPSAAGPGEAPSAHFGAALDEEAFAELASRLMRNPPPFLFDIRSEKIFREQPWEQYTLFILDPSRHLIKIQSFILVPEGGWL